MEEVNKDIQHVFIVGSKGIPAKYGGYETFVEQLTKRKVSERIKYHVACLANNGKEFEYNQAHCFNVKVPNIGPAKAIYYDYYALKYCIKFIKNNKIEHPIVYVLTCRIGPFFNRLVKKIHKLGGKVFLNPDGHERLRAKWSKPVRKYWKTSEKLMVKHSDLIICDSINIEKYIKDVYSKYNPKTTYIAYGADISKSTLSNDDPLFLEWCNKFSIKPGEYYLSVGRFVPENNFEIMIREFMNSKTKKDFVLITNVEKNAFYKSLESKYHFENDKRIKFVGTVYNEQLLKKIREEAFAYFHGHSVGGTNPSLLEALASTNLSILYDVGFNRECGEESVLYFTSEIGNLSSVIHKADSLLPSDIIEYGCGAKNNVIRRYKWDYICKCYEELFI